MIRFTFFRLASPSVLHMDFAQEQKEIALFASLINGDASNLKIKEVQVMTAAFKERLKLLDVIGERSYRIKHYLEEIPEGQIFLIVAGHIEDELTFFRYNIQLSQLNGEKTDTEGSIQRIDSYLWEHYEVLSFKGEDRRSIGTYDKSKRVCRFCGKSIPNVSFQHKSHAISEALGNKGLVCYEECDDCNSRFNNTIEQDLINLLAFHLLLHGVRGKKGLRTLKGDGITIRLNPNSRDIHGRDTLEYVLRDMPDIRDAQVVAHEISKVYDFPGNTYTPQNIYKCLCKYVISLIDSSELEFFQDTIAWINGPLEKHRLPPIWHYQVSNDNKTWEQPTTLFILRRKHSHKEIPYCWAIMIIAGDPYLFIVPFCSQDKYKFVGKSRQEFFLKGLKNMMNNVQFQPMDLNGICQQHLKIPMTFNIPTECIEGRDYYFLNPEDL